DCAEGGLAVAIAECCIGGEGAPRGAEVSLDDDLPANALLFGEAQSRIVVSCSAADAERVREHFEKRGIPAARIGRVGPAGGRLRIETRQGTIDAPAAELARI